MGRKPAEWYKSEECEKALELIEKGYSIGRVAEILGVGKPKINYAKRLYGVKSVRGFTTSEINYNDSRFAEHKQANITQDYNKRRKQESESQLAFLLLDKGFFYVGGYDGLHGKSDIKLSCLVCGGTFTRHDCVSLFKANQIQCPYCTAKVKEQEEQEREEKHQEYIKLQAEWERRRTQRQELIKENQEKTRTCKECGKEFTLKDYATRENIDITYINESAYCSSECRKKAERKNRRKYNVTHGKHKLRAIKYGVEFDRTVNLDDMLIRFGTKCALCGGECNINDYKIVNGARIYGDDYPSIDHIKPMSKGGSHTWDNVQVAHRGCNTRKGTNEVV